MAERATPAKSSTTPRPPSNGSCRPTRDLVRTIDDEAAETKVRSSLTAFEQPFFNNLTMALDRFFVHRIRTVTGKDTNPLNEVELICDSLMNNGGVFRAGTVVKYVAGKSVTKLEVGAPIRLTAEQFVLLSEAFFAELERKFL